MESTLPSETTFDVVCVGSGSAGLCAALTAADHGLKALVVEKLDVIGGTSAHSHAALWAGASSVAARAGYSDTLEAAATYMRFIASGSNLPANLDAYIESAPAVIDDLERLGLRFQVIPLPDHHYPKAPGSVVEGRLLEATPIDKDELGDWAQRIRQPPTSPAPYVPSGVTWADFVRWGGMGNRSAWPVEEIEDPVRKGRFALGQSLVAQLVRELLRREVPILTSTPMVRLAYSDGRVSGVIVSEDGSKKLIRANVGVVLSSGGYGHNKKLVRWLEGLEFLRVSEGDGTSDGDGFMAATEIGASVYNIGVNLSHMLSTGGIAPAYPHAITVNRRGKRFGDEATPFDPHALDFDSTTRSYVNLPAFVIFDSQYTDAYGYAGAAPGSPLPESLPRGHSLAELAGRLGIDPEGLESTVKAFNEGALKGEDPEFGRGGRTFGVGWRSDGSHKPDASLGTLEKAPYYGVQLTVGVGHNGTSGLMTNEHAQVMHVRGEPIPGLYAVGTTAAPTSFGAGYQAGFVMMGGLIFGYRAGRHAAGKPMDSSRSRSSQ